MKQLFTMLAITVSCFAFAEDNTWKMTFAGDSSDMIRDIVLTSQGQAMTGYTNSTGAGKKDILVMMMDDNGQLLWSRTYGNEEDQSGTKIVLTSDGSLLIIGETQSLDSTGTDIVVMKIDDNGNLIWAKTYKGSQGDYPANIIDMKDKYLIVGYSWSFSTSADFFAAMLDVQGNLAGVLYFDGGSHETCFGGIFHNKAFMLVGSRSSIGSDNGFAIKIDTAGSVLWAKEFGGNGVDQLNSVIGTDNGDYLFAGSTQSFGNGLLDNYIVKADKNGSHTWTRSIGSTSWEGAYALIENGNEYIVAGEGHAGDFHILNIDQSGITQWEQTFDDDSWARAFSISPTGLADGFIVGGLSSITGNSTEADILLVKITGEGVNCSESNNPESIISAQSSTTSNVVITTGEADLQVENIVLHVKNAAFVKNAICDDNFTGIASGNMEEMMALFPNPSQGMVTLNIPPHNSDLTLRIYNPEGKLVKSEIIEAHPETIRKVVDFSHLAGNLYHVSLQGKEISFNQRVIIY